MPMQTLEPRSLDWAYGQDPMLVNLNLRMAVRAGGNGCGKSTLLRSVCRRIKPGNGAGLRDGGRIRTQPTPEAARRLRCCRRGRGRRKGGRDEASVPA